MEFKQSPEDALASAFMSVIIPIHDAPKATRRCLTSIEKYAPKSEVILVDDGSGLAETVALVRDFGNRNGWEVIRHETPLGHSAACAAGARLASRPYLCLLNSDTVVTPWCWRGLKEVFDSDQRIGVAGPSTSYSGNTQTLPLALGCRLYWNDSQICAFARDLAAGCPDPVWVDLAWASGFAFFVRRGLWEELGGFDANLTDYGNERELCRRVSELGYRSVWVRNSYIHHFGEQSYGTLGEETISSRKRAAERYIARKHGA
jgi:GT2 family glycosyltransferase